MIRAVIFDFGGVLVRTPDRRSRLQWEENLGLAPGESEDVVFNSEMGGKAQHGQVSDESLWQWVGEHLQLDSSGLTAFRRAFWAGDVLDGSMVNQIRRLRPSYQTALLSNATDGLRPTLTGKYPIADAFDEIMISAEEGLMKPQPEIYLRLLRRLGRQPEEAVFIDDFAHNIAAARNVGMAAIHYRPGLDVFSALANWGVMLPAAA